MNILEMLCPFCIHQNGIKTELKIEYDPEQDVIQFECAVCKNLGELRREPRKPSLFVRIIQAIKQVWN